jgi:hypothetical protein
MLRESGMPVHREYGPTADAAREAMANVIREQK